MFHWFTSVINNMFLTSQSIQSISVILYTCITITQVHCHTCHGIINKLVVMATNDKCLQSALGDLMKQFKRKTCWIEEISITGTLLHHAAQHGGRGRDLGNGLSLSVVTFIPFKRYNNDALLQCEILRWMVGHYCQGYCSNKKILHNIMCT